MDVFTSKLDFEMKADEGNGLPRRGSDAHTDAKQFPDFFQKSKPQSFKHLCCVGQCKYSMNLY